MTRASGALRNGCGAKASGAIWPWRPAGRPGRNDASSGSCMERINERVLMAAVLVLAFGLRFWGFAAETGYVGDEHLASTADGFIEHGHYEPAKWFHQPAKFFVSYASIGLLGDNPYGRRLVYVLTGSALTLLLFLLGRELLADTRTAFLAALFMALDPAEIFFSRIYCPDLLSILLFTGSVYASVRHLKGGTPSPLPAGVLLGLAMAVKWYYALPGVTLAVIMVARAYRDRNGSWTPVLRTLLAYTMLPAAVYLLAFYPWFKRGSTLTEFVMMQIDSYRELQSLTLD